MSQEYKQLFFQKLVFPEHSRLGDNSKEITFLWNIFEDIYQKGNETIKYLIEHFLDTREEIQIFSPAENENSYFAVFTESLVININDGKNAITHELGHYFNRLILKNQIPEDFERINESAKKHATTFKHENFIFNNKEFKDANYRRFIEELCSLNTNNIKEREEFGLLSDLISGIHLGINIFNITETNEKISLPYAHSFYYYRDKGNVKYPVVFDEQFANFFAIYATNQQDHLILLQQIYGDEWYKTMTNYVEEIKNTLQERLSQTKN